MKDLQIPQPRLTPCQDARTYLMDSGLETTLIFHDGLDLPEFASFPLLESADGRDMLRKYYTRHLKIAADNKLGFILETATWRANPDWGAVLGYDASRLAEINRQAVALVADLRDLWQTPETPIALSGCIGPRGDGYVVDRAMSAEEAEAYHRPQIASLAGAGVNNITGLTIPYVEEAIGIARGAMDLGVAHMISFTVETDGRLPSGQPLGDAIAQVDTATGASPWCFMINCAHPTHFEDALRDGADWLSRIGGLRCNASRKSHAELDAADELDDGNPIELGQQYAELRRVVPSIRILGGCCGTDHRHIQEIARHA